MEFIRKNIQKNYKRNNDVAFAISSGSNGYSGGNIASISNKLDKSVWDESFYIDENGNLHCKKNFASDLGITAFASGYREVATIMDAIITDEETITKEDGVLKVIGGTGGSGVTNWDDLEGKPDWIGDSKPIYTWNDITDKPTTISGYGITDAVTLNTEQTISGQKTFVKTIYQGTNLANRRAISFVDTANNAIFADVNGRTIFRGNLLSFQTTNGTDIVKINNDGLFSNSNIETNSSVKTLDLYINGIHLYKSQDGFMYLDGDLAVTGGITAFAQGERTTSTIMDAIVCDETTITKQNGKLTVIGGVGGVSSWDDLTDKPDWITDSKPTYSWNEITSKPSTFTPSSHSHSISNITNLQTTLDGKANSNHTHSWSNITDKPSSFNPTAHTHPWLQINGKPTTISGYGITDAVTTNTLQDIVGQKTFKDVIYQTYLLDDYKRAISYVDANKNLIFGDTNANTFLRGKNIKVQNENGVDTLLISGTQISSNQPIACNADYITTTGWFQNTTAGKGLYNVEGNARFYYEKTFGGWKADKSILTTGGITCYGSDQRAKDIIEDVSLSLSNIANAPTVRFRWNNWKIKDDGKTHIGGIAQYTQKILPESVIESDDMLNMDYATTAYIFAVQTAKHLQSINNILLSKIEDLEKKITELNVK